MSMRKKNALLGFAALIVGGLLYLLFLENTYIGRLFGNFDGVLLLRGWCRPLACDFTRFFLPDLLWCFSLSCCLLAVRGAGRENVVICGVMALGCGFGWELLQYLSIIDGTGDPLDVFMYLLGCCLYFLINLKEKKNEKV